MVGCFLTFLSFFKLLFFFKYFFHITYMDTPIQNIEKKQKNMKKKVTRNLCLQNAVP